MDNNTSDERAKITQHELESCVGLIAVQLGESLAIKFARFIATPSPSAPPFNVEAMLTDCVPGGHSCDPQRVADAIRAYCGAATGKDSLHVAPTPAVEGLTAIRERLQNSVNWLMHGKRSGLMTGAGDFMELIRWIDALAAFPVPMASSAPAAPAVGAPVAWQERQQNLHGWTSWYACNEHTAVTNGKTEAFSIVTGGIPYEFRPLYLVPPAASAEGVTAKDCDPEQTQKIMTWQPIKTAPRDGTNILIAFGPDGVSQAKYVPGLPDHPWQFLDTNDGITWLVNYAKDGLGGPSHWKSLPQWPDRAMKGGSGFGSAPTAPARDGSELQLPPLTDEMRAVICNEGCVYQNADELYEALCLAARASAGRAAE